MKIDKMELVETGTMVNVVIPVSTSAPSNPSNGELYYNSTSKTIFMYDSNSAAWRESLKYTGNNILVGASNNASGGILQLGGGIKFPAVYTKSSSKPRLLDDYEEGTWTPSLIYSTGSSISGITYGTVTGRYTKIGLTIHLTFYMNVTSMGSPTATSVNLSGFPYLPASDTTLLYQTNVYGTLLTQNDSVYQAYYAGKNNAGLFYYSGASGYTAYNATALSSSGYLTGYLSFRTLY